RQVDRDLALCRLLAAGELVDLRRGFRGRGKCRVANREIERSTYSHEHRITARNLFHGTSAALRFEKVAKCLISVPFLGDVAKHVKKIVRPQVTGNPDHLA